MHINNKWRYVWIHFLLEQRTCFFERIWVLILNKRRLSPFYLYNSYYVFFLCPLKTAVLQSCWLLTLWIAGYVWNTYHAEEGGHHVIWLATGNDVIALKSFGTFKYPCRKHTDELNHVRLHRNVSFSLKTLFQCSTGRLDL